MFYQETLLFKSEGRSHYRIPSVIAAGGNILAFCNDRRDTVIDHASESVLTCAVKRRGEPWGDVQELGFVPGWACSIGSAVYDADKGRVFCFAGRNMARNEFGEYTDEEIAAMEKDAEEQAKSLGIHRGDIVFISDDGGISWQEMPLTIQERQFTTEDGRIILHGGSCHGSAHGIQIRHGRHAGRLLCPARFFTGRYSTWEDAIRCCYNTAIYSDDHGLTWKAAGALQQGTGEGTLIEKGDGRILYNSRSMHRDQKRLLAVSEDGGETYQDGKAADYIYEEKNIGCNASFLRVTREELPDLPEKVEAITLFANPRAEDRSRMTLCISLDDAETWLGEKLVFEGGSAYSSLDYDPVSKHFFLLYEKGTSSQDPYEFGIAAAEFDLQWLIEGFEV